MGCKVSTALILAAEQIGPVIDVLRRCLGTVSYPGLKPRMAAQLIAVIGRLTGRVQVRIILRPPSGPFTLAHALTRPGISLLLLFICVPFLGPARQHL